MTPHRPPGIEHPFRIGDWVHPTARPPAFREWEEPEFAYMHRYTESGLYSEDLERVLVRAHLATTAFLAARYDAELVYDMTIDSFLVFRSNFPEWARDRESGALLHSGRYGSKFAGYVQWRVCDVLRRKDPRVLADALTVHINQVVEVPSRPDELCEIKEREAESAASMRVLRDLANGDPVILLWLDGELSDAEISTRTGLPRSTVAPRLSRFRAKARKVLTSSPRSLGDGDEGSRDSARLRA